MRDGTGAESLVSDMLPKDMVIQQPKVIHICCRRLQLGRAIGIRRRSSWVMI